MNEITLKPQNTTELNQMLQDILDILPNETIQQSVLSIERAASDLP